MTTQRKQRADSVTAAIAMHQRAGRIHIPDHVRASLRPCDVPFFMGALKSRDDWQDFEYSILAQLACAQADYNSLQSELDTEGNIVKGRINPKCRLAETLCRRALSLARSLQIHARAKRGEARDAARIRTVEAVDDPQGLLA